MDLTAAITALRPGASWALNGDDYAGLVWLDDSTPPTLAELEAAWPGIENAKADEAARKARMEAFQSEADPLFFGWQREENSKQAWLDKCAEIRARFPYSTD